MSALPDRSLANYCANLGMISPFDADLVGPASIDLRIGNTILRRKTQLTVTLGDADSASWSAPSHALAAGFTIYPGEFALAATLETVKLRPNQVALVVGRSSVGRMGLQVECAGLIDPGFEGQVTLELTNLDQHCSVIIPPNYPICQMLVFRMDADAQRPYAERGRYQGQLGPTAARKAKVA